MNGRRWMQAHDARDDGRRLIAESVLFVLGLVLIVAAMSLADVR